MKQGGRVLVLDDEPEVAHATALLLRGLGHEAVECLAPSHAHDWLTKETFDLLISDYRMPEMNGLQLVSLLRNRHCQIPIMMMTAYFSDIDMQLAQSMGISTILRKPFGIDELDEAVKPLLRAFQQRQNISETLASDLSAEWVGDAGCSLE